MATIDSIEKEIAELENQQKAAQSKLNRLRKTKQKLIEQAEIDQTAANLKTIDGLIESANKSANEHSVQFEKDEYLDAILILVNGEYISESIPTACAEVDHVSEALDLFVRNAKALSIIYRDFNDFDFFRLDYDDENFNYIFFKMRIKEVSIEIFLHSSDRIKVTARANNLAYANGCVLIRAGKLTYQVSLCDSYDCFNIDAFVGEECSIEDLNETIDRLSKEIAKAKVIEED